MMKRKPTPTFSHRDTYAWFTRTRARVGGPINSPPLVSHNGELCVVGVKHVYYLGEAADRKVSRAGRVDAFKADPFYIADRT